jgi:hypothetical protein
MPQYYRDLTTNIKRAIVLKWHLTNGQIHNIHNNSNITTKHQNINIAVS